jgi:hypothetical protein
MNILYPAGVKREYYDRNGVAECLQYYNAAIAPHGTTQRFTYTVPANTRLLVMSVSLMTCRVTAAAPVGEAVNSILVIANGSGDVFAQTYLNNNTVGAVDRVLLSQLGWLYPGDTVECRTSDLSTGGTTRILSALQYLRFDL